MITELPRLLGLLPPGTLPAGRLVRPEDGGPPVYWLSDEPVEPALWARLRSRHDDSGLWPLLLTGLPRDERRPWADGEVFPAHMTAPDLHDAAELLARWWADRAEADEEEDAGAEADRVAATAPFGRRWPGLAEPGDPAGSAGHVAEPCPGNLLWAPARLGLVPASRGADTLALTGWSGPVNYVSDAGMLSAVVRSWEDRFGAQVVGLGFDTLHLAVAAPPTSPEHARRVAAEHFAFCPDNIEQGAGALTAYAGQIIGSDTWSFWWD
ncbi:DUF4253 domain-containing protein [Micromonospora sp. NPDC050980]|uniref:DUF4253 domain-containing protein n=1 Tax=Micromonospora sp. NPDC050980 TaxID=3155161 RepID=UPI003408BE20